jgi:hypothetical protein
MYCLLHVGYVEVEFSPLCSTGMARDKGEEAGGCHYMRLREIFGGGGRGQKMSHFYTGSYPVLFLASWGDQRESHFPGAAHTGKNSPVNSSRCFQFSVCSILHCNKIALLDFISGMRNGTNTHACHGRRRRTHLPSFYSTHSP